MYLTLVVDDDLFVAATKVALERRTNVNQMVREYLEALVEEAGRKRVARARLKETMANGLVSRGERNWSREDLHER